MSRTETMDGRQFAVARPGQTLSATSCRRGARGPALGELRGVALGVASAAQPSLRIGSAAQIRRTCRSEATWGPRQPRLSAVFKTDKR